MRSFVPTRLAVAIAAVSLAAPAAADSLRCDRGIVSTGDTRVDLLGRCGVPTWRDRRVEDRGAVAWDGDRGAGAGARWDAVVETWTYDRGPSAFVQAVVLVNGRVDRIERGSWGRADARVAKEERPAVSTCDGRFRPDDTKADLLSRCGEPAARDAWEERRGEVVRVDGGGDRLAGGWITVAHELWVYNFGPNRFVQLVHLENGKVTRVESGGYGYPE